MTETRIDGPMRDRYDEVLTAEALAFLADLHRRFDGRRQELLRCASSATPSWPRAGRSTSWTRPGPSARTTLAGRRARAGPGRPAGRDHRADRPQDDDQRAELRRQGVAGRPRGRQHPALGEHRRGPAQPARRDRARASTSGRRRARSTRLTDEVATIVVRPRGWHLPEKHIAGRRRADRPAASSTSASTSSTARAAQLDRGRGPYFYLPKMECHLEARLWNDVFVHAQEALGIPRGTIRATVLIETYPGRLRDGGDPLRAARALRRSQRRPLGLHVHRHQEVPRPRGGTSCCPTATR